ncbi:BON domain-containing protein [Luteimonas sp. R10]|uniref:BON domain-containing protein n=1 Tax=Luteimonas sp. R10 TaxID=3108176 RepID=UPI0030888118|nr:BON domain-containing protein [Luteimonas sp. R10]
MNTVFRLVAAFAAGAAAMYYLDPATGRRRRAMVRDQAVSACHDAEHFARAKSKRAADRVHGMLAETRSKFAGQPVDDRKLRERVRAKLGHVIDRSGAVEVEVHDGRVILSGGVPAAEIEDAVRAVAAMRGVEDVENRLSASTPGSGGRSEGAAEAPNLQH